MGSVRGRRGWSHTVAVALGLGWVAGCGEVPPGDPATARDDEDVTTVRAALSSSTDFWDGTGTIAVRVKTCDYASSQQSGSIHNACAICIMDADWARVGGGAEISGEATPGAQLIASRPDWYVATSPGATPLGCAGDGTAVKDVTSHIWIARSRGGVSHQLRAYAIGIKVKNTNGALVAPSITFPVDRNAGFVGSPAIASVTIDSSAGGLEGHIVLGGGAEIVPNSDNAYLIESAPVNTVNGLGWRTAARAVSGTPSGAIKVWAVGLDRCPDAWNNACFEPTISIREAIAAATSGYGTASYTLPSSWVTPVVGGKSPTTSGGGRYLADLIPFNGASRGATVRSKPSAVAGTGPTHAYTIALGRDRAPYTYNSIRFNQNGYSLYRPSGINPRLQQTPDPGDAPATRWHLERLSNGAYRIRNGNPDSGSECAYRVTGTTDVRVTTCGSGTEFQWTPLSGAIYTGPFQLKNATSSTLCLDNNGLAGTTPSNLTMKTCSALSNAQVLFLDVYNWPPS